MVSLTSRLKKLEAHAAHAHAGRPREPQTDADWLSIFEGLGRAGFFDAEPDFPRALEVYRRAVEAAGPGARFLKEWEWIDEMWQRAEDGTPPVSEREFAELSLWFRRNEGRLADLVDGAGLIDLGGGRRVDRTNLRVGLDRGPRSWAAGQVAEDVRALRQMFT
jgi:hypothetical protein